MSYCYLKAGHPVVQKLDKLSALMDHMGLSFSISQQDLVVTDNESGRTFTFGDPDCPTERGAQGFPLEIEMFVISEIDGEPIPPC